MKKSYPINKKISDFKHLNETFDKKKKLYKFQYRITKFKNKNV